MVQQGATLQQWAAATRWSGPADGPVDAQGVPRIPQQGVFLELWRSIGSVRFTSDCVRVCVCVCVRARMCVRVCARARARMRVRCMVNTHGMCKGAVGPHTGAQRARHMGHGHGVALGPGADRSSGWPPHAPSMCVFTPMPPWTSLGASRGARHVDRHACL